MTTPETAGAEMDMFVCSLIMGRCGPDYRRLSDTGEVWYHTMQGRAFAGRPYQIEEGGKWDHQWEHFEPSTRIEHAFEVVEKLNKRWHVGIDSLPDNKWQCTIASLSCEADTAPLAICRAALAALRAVGE